MGLHGLLNCRSRSQDSFLLLVGRRRLNLVDHHGLFELEIVDQLRIRGHMNRAGLFLRELTSDQLEDRFDCLDIILEKICLARMRLDHVFGAIDWLELHGG